MHYMININLHTLENFEQSIQKKIMRNQTNAYIIYSIQLLHQQIDSVCITF